MNKYATVIVTNSNKGAAQALLGDDFFDIQLKKGFSKYWVSSGYFLVEEYNAIVDSELAYIINTEDSFYNCLNEQGMTKVIIEE
jgi:flagellar basal body rod protein FlgG